MSSLRNTPCAPSRRRTDRGSALITVLLLAAIVAVVASHLLSRSAQEHRLATRSYYQSVALNLAEAGIEEAMWAANNNFVDSAHGWTDSGDGSGARVRTTTSGLGLAQGAGEIHLRLDAPGTSNPVATALGIVRLPGQIPISKQLRVPLSRRSVWANAIVAKDSVVFNGNKVGIDAYDSSVGPWNSTTNRLDKATVATNLAHNGGLEVNNADIFGGVATGGGQPIVGPGGSVLGATSPSGLPQNTDPNNVRTDFSYNIPDATLPSGTPVMLGAVSGTNLVLPRAIDTPGPNGRYVYQATSVDLQNKGMSVSGPVDLIITGDLTVGGASGTIVVGSGAGTKLQLYVGGNISISGQGAVNQSSSPPNMTIYGTRTQAQAATLGPQTFNLSGNAAYSGLVYAPNANVTLKGGGSTGRFDGAIIANSVTMNGNYDFHYDVQLAGIQSERFFRPGAWVELLAPPGSGAPLARDNRAPFAGAL